MAVQKSKKSKSVVKQRKKNFLKKRNLNYFSLLSLIPEKRLNSIYKPCVPLLDLKLFFKNFKSLNLLINRCNEVLSLNNDNKKYYYIHINNFVKKQQVILKKENKYLKKHYLFLLTNRYKTFSQRKRLLEKINFSFFNFYGKFQKSSALDKFQEEKRKYYLLILKIKKIIFLNKLKILLLSYLNLNLS